MNNGFEKLVAKVNDSISSSDVPCIICCKKNALNQILEKLQFEGSIDHVYNSMTIMQNNRALIYVELADEMNPYKIGSSIAQKLQELPMEKLQCIIPLEDDDVLMAIESCLLRYPSYVKYKSETGRKPKEVTFLVSNKSYCEKEMITVNHIVQSVLYVRGLVNTGGNHHRPSDMAAEAYKLEDLKIKCKVLQGEAIKDMQCLTMVGQASSDKPKLIILEWLPQPESSDIIALVGKGITFDSGGLTIKTSGMDCMKIDMTGGATVMGILRAIASMSVSQNVIGVIPCAENMISGDALRPGDILKSYSGKTVEVIDTDYEGRLVLADGLAYVQAKYNPSIVIDIATLTGDVITCLGHIKTGLFSNSDELSDSLIKAGERVWERLWRLPLDPSYDAIMNSEIADIKNKGSEGAGSIVAAQFLQRFVKDGVKWAHLDIAGTSFIHGGGGIFHDKFASGVGVRLILEAIASGLPF